MTTNKLSDERIKIACFRAITNQLRDRHLVTDDEYRKIVKHLEQMEKALIAGKPAPAHSRKSSVVE